MQDNTHQILVEGETERAGRAGAREEEEGAKELLMLFFGFSIAIAVGSEICAALLGCCAAARGCIAICERECAAPRDRLILEGSIRGRGEGKGGNEERETEIERRNRVDVIEFFFFFSLDLVNLDLSPRCFSDDNNNNANDQPLNNVVETDLPLQF